MDSRESGLWVPASEHQSGAVYDQHPDDDEDDDEEDQQVDAPTGITGITGPNGEQRGREEERQVAV